MASVYLASTGADGGFSKVVALKRIHAHLARDPRFVDMFLDEARVASRITHPNVCSVFDFGAVEGTYFIAMEYLMGETFSSVHRALKARDRKDYVAHLAEIFAQAAEGLHAAHELRGDDGELLGVVHRDVSPQNLFLTYDGCVKVVDFGVARCEGRIQHTEPGTIKGKLAYIPPEQVRCQDVDRRSDVWSLGVTLWEMLVGRSLFRRGNDIETLQAVASAPIAAPSTLVEGIPPALDEIVMKALARELDARWQTAREMSRALRDLTRSEGARVGQVELEEWMLELFPAQRRQKQAMVQAARESSAVRSRPGSELTPVSGNRRPGSKVSGTHARAARSVDVPIDDQGEPLLLYADVPPAAMAAGHTALRPPPSSLSSDPLEAPRRPPVPGSFWAGMAVAGVIAISLGGWALALFRAPPAPAVPSSAASPAPPPAVAIAPAPDAHDEIAEPATDAEESRAEPRPAAAPVARPDVRSTRPRAGAAGRPVVRARRAEEPRQPEPRTPDAASEPEVEREIAERAPSPAPEAVVPEDTVAPARSADPASTPSPPTPPPGAVASSTVTAGGASPVRSAEPSRPRSAPAQPTPPPPPRPSLEASVSIEGLRMGGSLPMSAVRQAIDRLQGDYARCYRGAAQRAQRDGAGTVDVQLTIDEMGLARRVRVSGGPLPGLASCVQDVTSHLRSRLRPDTGTEDVAFGVRYAPRPGAR